MAREEFGENVDHNVELVGKLIFDPIAAVAVQQRTILYRVPLAGELIVDTIEPPIMPPGAQQLYETVRNVMEDAEERRAGDLVPDMFSRGVLTGILLFDLSQEINDRPQVAAIDWPSIATHLAEVKVETQDEPWNIENIEQYLKIQGAGELIETVRNELYCDGEGEHIYKAHYVAIGVAAGVRMTLNYYGAGGNRAWGITPPEGSNK